MHNVCSKLLCLVIFDGPITQFTNQGWEIEQYFPDKQPPGKYMYQLDLQPVANYQQWLSETKVLLLQPFIVHDLHWSTKTDLVSNTLNSHGL